MKPSLLTTDTVSATEGFLSLLVINAAVGTVRAPAAATQIVRSPDSRLR